MRRFRKKYYPINRLIVGIALVIVLMATALLVPAGSIEREHEDTAAALSVTANAARTGTQ